MNRRKASSGKTKAARRPGKTKLASPVAAERRKAAETEKGVEAKAPSRTFELGKTTGFPIVGVGASAGGLEALEALFRGMPANTGLGFVVVSHLHPGHTSMLPELLGKATRLPVVEARDGVQVLPDHVYVGPSGGYLAIFNGALHRMETDPKQV